MSNQEHSSGDNEHIEHFLSLQTLIAIIILLMYTIAAPLFEKYHFHYMHESGVCMIIGVLVTLVAMVINPKSNMANTLEFSDEMFFTFILPPIIFAAGYNIRKRAFFKYFLYIILFGVLGTIITFLVVTPLIYAANENNFFSFTFYNPDPDHLNQPNNESTPNTLATEIISHALRQLSFSTGLNDTEVADNQSSISSSGKQLIFSVREILLFASVISATDTVAALTFVKEDTDPKLFSILFGEGVMNDAVCIVLYKILLDFTSTNEEFTSKTPVMMIGSFLNLFFFSFVVGSLVGIISSLFLKKLKFLKLNRVQETSVVIFFAFISYTLSEEMGLSPIIALLFTGIVMSHYTFYNLSFQAREESAVVSRMMANIAEAFVFTYLGLTMIKSMTTILSMSFLFWALIFVIFGRIVAIFGLSYIMKVFKVHNFKIKFSEKGIMSCAGSIRGAIAFGLAISIDTPNPINKQVLVNSTLILVFFTTIVFGALMPFLIKFFKSFDPEADQVTAPAEHSTKKQLNENAEIYQYMHPNFIEDDIGVVKEKDEKILKQRLSYWLGTYWVEFDDMYMKPKLVHNWPNVKDDNDKIAQRIKEAIDEYKSKRDNPGVEIDEKIYTTNKWKKNLLRQNNEECKQEADAINNNNNRSNSNKNIDNPNPNLFKGLTVKK